MLILPKKRPNRQKLRCLDGLYHKKRYVYDRVISTQNRQKSPTSNKVYSATLLSQPFVIIVVNKSKFAVNILINKTIGHPIEVPLMYIALKNIWSVKSFNATPV